LHNAKDIFDKYLQPMDCDAFFDEHVSRSPLALLGSDHSHRQSMLGRDPQETILAAFDKFAPHLTCHAHAPVKPPPVPHDVDNAEDFLSLIREYHANNYTVRIPSADTLTFELQQFLRAIETLISSPADAAIFWSHAGAAAPVHHDEYDIIAIQLAGRKKWFISSDEPALPNQWAKPGEGPPALNSFNIYDVAPGDLLYLPRGTAHTVQSTSESIHLSIGFVPVTIRDAMIAALDQMSDIDRALRENLISAKQPLPDVLDQHLSAVVDQCRSDTFLKSAMELRKARMIFGLNKLPKNIGGETLSLNSAMRHHPLAIAHITTTPKIVDFTIPGEHILVHLGAERAMRFIADTPEFSVRDIDDSLDEDVRVALAQKLYESGFLEIAA